MLLVTGSAGLIGRAICERLTRAGIAVTGYDLRDHPAHDTRNPHRLASALAEVTGVIHLAAVSRVVWAQQAPDHAHDVNVAALAALLKLLHAKPVKPWLIFASSREVYGDQATLPVAEDAALSPLNVYARTKVAGERLVEAAASAGVPGQIVRFSNVYGSTGDHPDRVIPAFARTAACGGQLRVDGSSNMFDFTHVDDASEGLFLLVQAMMAGETMPPIHFLTGAGTTLGEAAQLACRHARAQVVINEAPARDYDVARFIGDPRRARELLGWQAGIDIERGFAQLVAGFWQEAGAATAPPPEAGALV